MRFLIILIMWMSTVCFGATNDSASLKQEKIMQNFLHDILQHTQSPWGVTALSMVAQCKDNPPIVVYGGFTSKDNKTPINENSLFPIASNTKAFIAVVMLQIAQEYKLNLDSQKVIGKYFPEYPKWGKITIRQLLNMTSGIPGTYTADSDDIYKKFTQKQFESYISPTEILNKVYPLTLHFKSGTQWEYSNTNYILLGMLIKKITHHNAEEEIQKRIINPLKLHHTYFPTNTIYSIPGVKRSEVVHSYAYYHKTYSFIKFGQDTVNFSLSLASYGGYMVSTPKDINIFLHALFQPNKLLTSSQLKEFTTLISRKNGKPFNPKNSPDDFGFGLAVFGAYSAAQDGIVYFYQGANDGSQFVYFYNPKTQLFLTFGVNTRSSDLIGKENSMAFFDALNEQCSQQSGA